MDQNIHNYTFKKMIPGYKLTFKREKNEGNVSGSLPEYPRPFYDWFLWYYNHLPNKSVRTKFTEPCVIFLSHANGPL